MLIHQGDIYWRRLDNQDEGAIAHPYVVIQVNATNDGQILTVVACALTSNINRVSIPGNVLLEAGEADLPKQSVVEVSKVVTIEPTQLGAFIGTLSERRVQQILAGSRFIQKAFLHDKT